MLLVFSNMVVLFAFIILGFLLTKLKKLNADHAKILSALLVNLFLPFKIFKSFAKDINLEYILGREADETAGIAAVAPKYPLLIVSAVALLIIFAISILIARTLEKNKYNQDIYIYTFTIPNFGYTGYSLAMALPAVLAEGIVMGGYETDVIVFSIPLNIFTFTVGISMLTKTKLNLKGLLHPVIIAMVLGCIVGISGFTFPTFTIAGVDKPVDFINDVLNAGNNCVAPLSMILAGITVAEYKFSDILGDWKIYLASALRLIIIPLALGGVIMVFINFGVLGKDSLFCALCCFAMPCGLNTVIFPRLVGENCRIGAGTAVVSNILCIFTIPVMFSIFGIM